MFKIKSPHAQLSIIVFCSLIWFLIDLWTCGFSVFTNPTPSKFDVRLWRIIFSTQYSTLLIIPYYLFLRSLWITFAAICKKRNQKSVAPFFSGTETNPVTPGFSKAFVMSGFLFIAEMTITPQFGIGINVQWRWYGCFVDWALRMTAVRCH
jgi:ABC-type phosphate transport system permease subunit